MTFRSDQIRMDKGDTFFAYTDGITEARGPDGAFFGEERLMRLLHESDLSPINLLEHIKGDVHDHIADSAPSDDITMLALQRQKE